MGGFTAWLPSLKEGGLGLSSETPQKLIRRNNHVSDAAWSPDLLTDWHSESTESYARDQKRINVFLQISIPIAAHRFIIFLIFILLLTLLRFLFCLYTYNYVTIFIHTKNFGCSTSFYWNNMQPTFILLWGIISLIYSTV